jgi:uncharacterized phage protein (TIGR01671 family)
MRELKFKFWNKLAHRFQAPNKYAIQGDGLYVSYDYDMMAWDDPSSFDDSILVPCQYTGLKDKNGKEIYEGDIIEVELYEKWSSEEPFKAIHVVFYNSNRGAFVHAKDPKTFPSGMVFDPYTFDPVPCEVIGNIFNNPKLLKQ